MNPKPRKASKPGPSAQLNRLLCDSHKAGTSGNVIIVYEDAATRQWAREVYEQVNPALKRSAQVTWWKMGEFRSPGVLAGAVSMAMRADAVVIATQSTESLPLAFYYWVTSWLPHRHAAKGLLVALLGVPHPPIPPAGRVRAYLRALAEKAGMEFVLEEQALLTALPPHLPMTTGDLALH